MPVFLVASTTASRSRVEGLSISTPAKPSFLMRLNFSVGVLPGAIMPYLTAFLRRGSWGLGAPGPGEWEPVRAPSVMAAEARKARRCMAGRSFGGRILLLGIVGKGGGRGPRAGRAAAGVQGGAVRRHAPARPGRLAGG